jgi:hypothetical protein
LAWTKISWGGPGGFGFYIPSVQFRLSFVNRQTRIIQGIVLVIRTVVGDAAYHFLWIVAAGEGTFGICPIVLGLALVVAGHRPWAFLVVA